jgi:hypothetical protein
MDELIRQAIAERRIVAYRYNGQRRYGEPHLYGVMDGQPKLLVYQTGGTSFSGPYPNWRRLDLAGISRFTITGRSFEHPRLNSSAEHPEWTEIWAIVR